MGGGREQRAPASSVCSLADGVRAGGGPGSQRGAGHEVGERFDPGVPATGEDFVMTKYPGDTDYRLIVVVAVLFAIPILALLLIPR